MNKEELEYSVKQANRHGDVNTLLIHKETAEKLDVQPGLTMVDPGTRKRKQLPTISIDEWDYRVVVIADDQQEEAIWTNFSVHLPVSKSAV